MAASRSLDVLLPEVRTRALRFLAAAEAEGIDLVVTATGRDYATQRALYAIGRTVKGEPCSCGRKRNPIGSCLKHPMGLRVTNADAGESWHNWLRALDVVPMRHGKPVWSTRGDGIDDDPTDDATDDLELWQRVGMLGEAAGLEWAGRWKKFPEFPHFQFTGGLSLSALRRAHPHGLTF